MTGKNTAICGRPRAASGAWAIKVNGPQLRDVLDQCVNDRQFLKLDSEAIEKYRKHASEMEEGKSVAFVVAEL